MRFIRHLLLCCLLAGSAPAESETPSPADLLVVPEVSERSAGTPDGAPSRPSPPPQGSGKKPPVPGAGDSSPAEPAVEAPADDMVPPPFPLSRYEDLWKKSPFQLESIAPPVESAGLAQRYALTGIAEISGEPIAFIMERATQQRMMVRKDAAGSGLSLVQIDVADKKYDESTVTLRQGAEVGVVKFDAGPAMPAPAMASPVAQAAGIPQAQTGNAAPRIPGLPAAPAPPPIPGRPGPTAAVPGQVAPGVVPPVPGPGIPQNGQVQQPGQPQMPPPRVIRRRAIVPAAP